MTEIIYLGVEQLVEINKRVLKDIRVKKADSHRVASRKKLNLVVAEVRSLDGDVFEKAAALMVALTREHAFDSGNRRTAFAAAELFLEANGKDMTTDPDPNVMMGIREGFYRTDEVVEWLRGNGIREFKRRHS